MKIEFATIEPFFATLVHYGSKSEVSGEVSFYIFYFSGRTVFCYLEQKRGYYLLPVAKAGFWKKNEDTCRQEDPGDRKVLSPGGRSALSLVFSRDFL